MASKLLLLMLLAVVTTVATTATTNNATTTQPPSDDSNRLGTVAPAELSAPAADERSVRKYRPNAVATHILVPGARPSAFHKPRPAGVASGAFATPRPPSGVTGMKPKPRPGYRPSAHINRDGLIGAGAAAVLP